MSNRRLISAWAGIIFSMPGLVQISEGKSMAGKSLVVTVQKVSFPNKSISVVGNLFTPANLEPGK